MHSHTHTTCTQSHTCTRAHTCGVCECTVYMYTSHELADSHVHVFTVQYTCTCISISCFNRQLNHILVSIIVLTSNCVSDQRFKETIAAVSEKRREITTPINGVKRNRD